MDLVSGCPYWPLKNGLLATYPPLREHTECDVAIIGGGITGALVGFRLVEAGLSAVVLDRREIGFGSTGASTSLLQYEADLPLHKLARRVGQAAAVRSYELSREAITDVARLARTVGDACDFEAKESFLFSSRQAHVPGLRREFEARRSAGFDVEWWTRRQIARESSFPYGAAIVSRDAAQFDSFRFTHALLRHAQTRGLRIFDRTEVTSWKRRGGGLELHTAEGWRVKAGKLVIAAGYEAQRYLPRGLTRLHSTYAVISEPVRAFDGWPDRRLVWETARPYVYLRTTPERRAIIGGFDEPFRDPAARDALLPQKQAALTRRFRRLLPGIDDFQVAYAWTGTFAETADSLAYIDASPDEPNVLFALGYGGNGITYGVVAATIIRDLVLGKPNADARLFRFGR